MRLILLRIENQDEKTRSSSETNRFPLRAPFCLLREPSGTLWILSPPSLVSTLEPVFLPPVGAEQRPAGRQLALSQSPPLCAACRRRQHALIAPESGDGVEIMPQHKSSHLQMTYEP